MKRAQVQLLLVALTLNLKTISSSAMQVSVRKVRKFLDFEEKNKD